MFRNNLFDEMSRMEKMLDLVSGNMNCVALMPKKETETREISRIPLGNIYETESSVIAAFELPGVSKEDIQLNITEDNVEVKVEKKTEKKAEDNSTYEMRSHSFYGALPLPTDVIAESADASYKDGILRVEIPKAKKQDSRKRIEVK